mmetsp:Transcript_57662/g.135746  ORF Transcript_57662/g.135746 Transcript_57662/m.135746 type:complete len:208 (+) Transcript_57662:1182-1805(+)
MAAQQHQRHGRAIVTRVDVEALGRVLDQRGGALDVAGGLLDAEHARQRGTTQRRLGQHVRNGPAGHVVEHHRDVHGLGDRLEVLVNAFLRRLVVVGHDGQRAVRTDGLGIAAQFDGLGGRIGAGACQDGDAALGMLDRDADDLAVFLHADRGRLARGADHADAGGAGLDMPVDQATQGGVVDAAVLVHGRDEGDDAAEDGLHGVNLV